MAASQASSYDEKSAFLLSMTSLVWHLNPYIHFVGDSHVSVPTMGISIWTLLGAILFIIGASVVFPAFFGYRI